MEGYVESSAMGILAAISAHQILSNEKCIKPPLCTLLGSLYNYLIISNLKYFAPKNANFGILYNANKNREECAKKAINDIKEYWSKINVKSCSCDIDIYSK